MSDFVICMNDSAGRCNYLCVTGPVLTQEISDQVKNAVSEFCEDHKDNCHLDCCINAAIVQLEKEGYVVNHSFTGVVNLDLSAVIPVNFEDV